MCRDYMIYDIMIIFVIYFNIWKVYFIKSICLIEYEYVYIYIYWILMFNIKLLFMNWILLR